MPTISLGHLNESLLGYWIRLCDVVREMITFAPQPGQSMKVNGQEIPYCYDMPLAQEKKSKHYFIKYESDRKYLF